MLTLVKDIFTLNFLASQQIKVIPKYPSVLKVIIQNLPFIIRTFLSCWQKGSEFMQVAKFEKEGTAAYSFNRCNNYNKMLNMEVAE